MSKSEQWMENERDIAKQMADLIAPVISKLRKEGYAVPDHIPKDLDGLLDTCAKIAAALQGKTTHTPG